MNNTIINHYGLIPMRCINCNNPIGHLYNDYQTLLSMNNSESEAYNILGIINYCCKKSFFVQKIPYDKSKLKLKSEPKNEVNVIYNKNVLKYQKLTNSDILCVPVHIKISPIQKKINDNLYISYVNESVYMAL